MLHNIPWSGIAVAGILGYSHTKVLPTCPRGPLVFNGGYDARTQTLKIDRKLVLCLVKKYNPKQSFSANYMGPQKRP